MKRVELARRLVKMAKELVGAPNEKALIASLEAMGFTDWTYANLQGKKGIFLSARLYRDLHRYVPKFRKLASKYGYVYLPTVKGGYFISEAAVGGKRKTISHRGIEIVAPSVEGVVTPMDFGGIDPTQWLVPEMGNAEFSSLKAAKQAIDEMYADYLQNVADYPEDDFGTFQDWLEEWEV